MPGISEQLYTALIVPGAVAAGSGITLTSWYAPIRQLLALRTETILSTGTTPAWTEAVKTVDNNGFPVATTSSPAAGHAATLTTTSSSVYNRIIVLGDATVGGTLIVIEYAAIGSVSAE
jgi:hypothetical protein